MNSVGLPRDDVHQQSFVGVGGGPLECLGVVEIQRDGLEPDTAGPGSFAVMCSRMPSLGCSWMTSLLGSLLPSLSGNIGCGTGLN